MCDMASSTMLILFILAVGRCENGKAGVFLIIVYWEKKKNKLPAPRKRIRTRLHYFQSDLKAFKFFHTSNVLYEFSIYKNWKILISGDEAVLFPHSCVIAYSFRYHSNGVKLPITLGKEIVLFFYS